MENIVSDIKKYGLTSAGEKVVVACSGGKDSMALLHYLWSNKEDLGIEVAAVNVDHSIRENSAQDSEFVKNFCKKNGASALPAKPNHTLHDGDGLRDSGEPYSPECKGCYVITVSTKQKPVIVDSFRNPITDPGEVYSGCYGRASINFYGYNTNGKKGVSAGLLSIQKLHDGEPFGTVGSADDFADGYQDGEGDDFML